jgi:hypothetical protein
MFFSNNLLSVSTEKYKILNIISDLIHFCEKSYVVNLET